MIATISIKLYNGGKQTCEVDSLVDMLHSVVRLQYHRIEEHVGLDAERTVHVRVTIRAVRVGAQHWFVVVLRALDSNTGVSLKHDMWPKLFHTFSGILKSIFLSLSQSLIRSKKCAY